ncbi:MAG: lysine biosynthesis protein LysW [Thermoplasmatota archaeon]
MTQTTVTALECPECAAKVPAQPTMTGEIVDCPDCSAELEVVSLSPLRVALAPEVEEDWGE